MRQFEVFSQLSVTVWPEEQKRLFLEKELVWSSTPVRENVMFYTSEHRLQGVISLNINIMFKLHTNFSRVNKRTVLMCYTEKVLPSEKIQQFQLLIQDLLLSEAAVSDGNDSLDSAESLNQNRVENNPVSKTAKVENRGVNINHQYVFSEHEQWRIISYKQKSLTDCFWSFALITDFNTCTHTLH